MAQQAKGNLEIEDLGAVLVVRIDGGPHQLFGRDIAQQRWTPWFPDSVPPPYR